MYMHALVDAVHSSAGCHCVDDFLDKLGGVGPYDVEAQYPSAVSVNYSLAKPSSSIIASPFAVSEYLALPISMW